MAGWIILALILAVVIAILVSEVEFKLRIRRYGRDDDWQANIRWLYGLVRYKVKVPKIRWTKEEGVEFQERALDSSKQVLDESKTRVDVHRLKREYRKLMEILRNTFEFSRWLKETLRHVRMMKLNWQTTIGSGDAVETATLTGLAWGLKGSIVGYISNYIKLRVQPRLHITPHYQESNFTTDFTCIFKIRTGYAMIAGLLLLVRIIRIKGGLKTWRSILFKAS